MVKQLLKLQLSVIISLIGLTVTASCHAAAINGNKQNYQPSQADFANPERGFYISLLTRHQESPIRLSELERLKDQNITLVRRIYVIPQYRYQSLPESFLDFVRNDLSVARQAGVKLVVRFAYNWDVGGYDAPKDVILTQLEQLQPILTNNSDVIAYLEAGFVGAWGQWNRSSHQLINNVNLDITADSRAIFSKILRSLPSDRMVALPFPKQKMEMFNTTQPLSLSEAFSGSDRARTATHNDGFLAGHDNLGFYTYRQEKRDREYLRTDNLYVVHGGETASASSYAQPYIGCANALAEMEEYRWSVLNLEFHQTVIQGWKEQGCMPEIRKRLGYRFRLLETTIPRQARPSGRFAMSFVVTNDGWANAYNPRRVEIVLRHKQTNKEYYLAVQAAPRKWLPGKTQTVNVEAGLPANMLSGEYQVFLNLPDPSPRLYNRPSYSIRLANQNMWEATTGYNLLSSDVTISSDVAVNRFSSDRVFRAR